MAKERERHREQWHDSVKTGSVKPEYEVACQDPDHPAGVPIFYRTRRDPDGMRSSAYLFRCPVCRSVHRRNYHRVRSHEVNCQSPNHPADMPRRFLLRTRPSLYEKNGWRMNCPLCRKPHNNKKADEHEPMKAYVADWTRYQVQPYCPPPRMLRWPKSGTPKASKQKPEPESYQVRCRDPLHNSALHPVKFKSKLSSEMYRERGYPIRCPGCRKRKERQRWKGITPAVEMVIDPPLREKSAQSPTVSSWRMPEQFPRPPKGISNQR